MGIKQLIILIFTSSQIVLHMWVVSNHCQLPNQYLSLWRGRLDWCYYLICGNQLWSLKRGLNYQYQGSKPSFGGLLLNIWQNPFLYSSRQNLFPLLWSEISCKLRICWTIAYTNPKEDFLPYTCTFILLRWVFSQSFSMMPSNFRNQSFKSHIFNNFH